MSNQIISPQKKQKRGINLKKKKTRRKEGRALKRLLLFAGDPMNSFESSPDTFGIDGREEELRFQGKGLTWILKWKVL